MQTRFWRSCHPGFLRAKQDVRVTGQPVEFGNDDPQR
jgi:hypothetical protein